MLGVEKITRVLFQSTFAFPTQLPFSAFSFFGTWHKISCPCNTWVKLFKWQHANTYQVQNGSRNFCQETRNALTLWRPKLICVNIHFLHHRKLYVPRYRANTTSLFV